MFHNQVHIIMMCTQYTWLIYTLCHHSPTCVTCVPWTYHPKLLPNNIKTIFLVIFFFVSFINYSLSLINFALIFGSFKEKEILASIMENYLPVINVGHWPFTKKLILKDILFQQKWSYIWVDYYRQKIAQECKHGT